MTIEEMNSMYIHLCNTGNINVLLYVLFYAILAIGVSASEPLI
jgi:hypothetical protein